jgi:hypothetical protein
MAVSAELPDHDALAAELKLLREKGLARIRSLELPALVAAGRIATADESSEAHVVVEAALRRAVERFGGGAYGEAAALLFGLDQGTRTLNSRVRRELAAERMERTADTFRKRYEPTMLGEIATQILTLCSEQHSRSARSETERRYPAESAMAVEWLRRFEAYYRLWTPISGLGNDLTAYRSTLFEAGRPWDRRFGTKDPIDPGYSQEEQAEGYARFALYHYARYQWELRRFVNAYGGLWLLSDGETEQAVSDAVYRIFWHTTGNERDDSFLRTVLQDTPNQELHGFLERLASTEIGRETHREWQEWVGTCECVWKPEELSSEEYFPTRHHHAGINATCQIHGVIEACGDYLDLIDRDWRKIADWYHLGEAPSRGVDAGKLYDRFRKGQAPEDDPEA